MLSEKTTTVNDITINYAEGPASDLPVIFLHGVTNRWQTYLPVLPTLGWRYHVFALDHRGHGHSGRGERPYLSGKLAQDVISFIEAVVGRPAVIVGHSLGAMITLKVAAQAKPWVKAIVVEDPPLFAAADGGGAVPPWFAQYHEMLTTMDSVDEQLARLTEIAARISEATDPVAIRSQLINLRHVDLAVLLDGQHEQLFADFSVADVLPQIECPTLILRGNPDLGGVMPEHDSLWVTKLMPHAMEVYTPEMGHNLHRTQPHRYVTVVTQFIESL